MMGFDPLSVKFIRLAHERGLGCGDPRDVEVVGEDVSDVNFHFHVGETLASRGQKAIYWGPLHRLERLLLRSVLAPWSYAASFLYHDVFWYNFVGRARVERALQTDWGKLFAGYDSGTTVNCLGNSPASAPARR
jgi:hypothetical protein